MNIVKGKVAFNKSGKNSTTARINLPKKIYEQLDITYEDRDVEISVVENEIIIKKISRNKTHE